MMLTALPLVILFAGVFGSPTPPQGSDPTGLWQTPTSGGQVRISRCGPALCGVLVTANNIRANPDLRDSNNANRALRTRTNRGVQMLSGFTGGPTVWRGGSVYNPSDGRTYRGTITLTNADTLSLRGCVIAPLCRTQSGTRVR